MSSPFQDRSSDRPIVVTSLEDAEGLRCVDIIKRTDGLFTFKEFRRDPEDSGRWTLVADYSQRTYASKTDALRAAASSLAWFAAVVDGKSA
jgi:hypothetical protein